MGLVFAVKPLPYVRDTAKTRHRGYVRLLSRSILSRYKHGPSSLPCLGAKRRLDYFRDAKNKLEMYFKPYISILFFGFVAITIQYVRSAKM